MIGKLNKHRPVRQSLVVAVGVLLLPWLAVNAQAQDNLTEGAVFAMSNASDGNVVVAYQRNPDGSLDEVGRFDTSGSGSGSFEDTANGLVLATVAGEIAPNNLIEPNDSDPQFLFVTNAGSNSISVFAVRETELKLVDVEESNGEKPVSLTINNGLVYVLNSGETDDSLFDAEGNVIDNCTTGEQPTVTGFNLDAEGQLTPILGSTRWLSLESASGCAQVSFDPSGQFLVVTERLAQPPFLRQQTSDVERLDDEGVIDVFAVNPSDGSLSLVPRVIDATGQGPFGFTFTQDGILLTTEQFDGPGGPGRGAAASYLLNPEAAAPSLRPKRDDVLLRSSPSIQNMGTDTCWIVTTDDQTLGFATSFFADGRISSYELDDLGLVRLVQAVATGENAENDDVQTGASDLALSRDSTYLYQLNSINGTINAFLNNGDGTLTLIEQETPFPQPPFGPGEGEAAPIGLAAS